MLAIETHALTRRFGTAGGVESLDLKVPGAGIYGFLGPNGAGKTTTIRLLLGLLHPQAGTILLDGQVLDARRQALAGVGAMVEAPSLYPHLSGRQNLEITRCLRGLDRSNVDRVLEIVGLAGDADRRTREYSLGMRQRLGIALALLANPRLLVLDEPGNGLDPAGTREMRALLRRLVDDLGTTVFMSSHLLGEVEHVADHVGVLANGQIRFQGSLEELRAMHAPRLRIGTPEPARGAALLAGLGESVNATDRAIWVERPGAPVAALNRALVQAGIDVDSLQQEDATLESLFFQFTRDTQLEDAA